MPATLKSIQGMVGQIDIALDTDLPVEERDPENSFHVTYKRHNLTAAHEALAQEAVRDDRALRAVCEMIVPILVSWDLKEDPESDAPIPIDVDTLVQKVPSSILMLIIEQIGEAQRPNTNGTGKP